MKKYLNNDYLTNSRGFIMGISTLLIVLFHTGQLNMFDIINFKPLAILLNYLQKVGNCGVDIFLFLSGMGLYFSLTKNNLNKFYSHRFTRIIPPFIITVLIFNILTKNYLNIFETIFCISFFIKGNLFLWFIQFILILYLIYPIIYKVINKGFHSFLILIFSIITTNFLLLVFLPTIYYQLEIALTRIPIFIIGAYFGKIINNKEKLPSKIIPISLIIFILINIFIYLTINVPNKSLFLRYLYCPLSISIIILISKIYSLINNKNNFIIKFFNFFGNYSLEVYLLYEQICYLIKINNFKLSYLKVYSIGFILTIILSYFLKKLTNIINNKLIHN